ncbi:uncharacterized protein LOC105840971 [Monomorium pharaonis]|uniref:uncharacterized protein LOC105840971 n=1 Tax=Monomorium pharaonis TaxID=307658 RepID=UPI001747C0AC|nr:uncharacterized protein LOC105840971 [Monomorium pharaonis]
MTQVNNIQYDTLEDIFLRSSSKNLDKTGFVTFFKDVFGVDSRHKFPNKFDVWPVKEQCDWIYQNITNFFPNVPQSLLNLIPATFCEIDFYDRSPQEIPKWMDLHKYRRGQKFVEKNYMAIIMSTIMGLIYVYAFGEELRPLVLGEHSHTPYLAFRKYSSTIKRMISWYKGDPWIKGTEAYKDMQVTRRMHLAVKKKVRQMDHKQMASACIFANPWSLDRELLLKDFVSACPPEKFGQRYYTITRKSQKKSKGMNNMDFAIAQSAFVVLPLLYPQNIGIYNATDEDLEAFSHMWQCYGYFLGQDDEHNICRGNFEEVKQRLRDLYQYWIKENFKELTPEFEHITRCLIEHVNYYPILYLPYKTGMLLTAEALNLNMPYLHASLSYGEWIAYKIYKFLIYALRFSSVRSVINKIILKILDKAVNFNIEKLAEIHEKSKKLVPDFSLT